MAFGTSISYNNWVYIPVGYHVTKEANSLRVLLKKMSSLFHQGKIQSVNTMFEARQDRTCLRCQP